MKQYPHYPVDEITNLRDLVDNAASKNGDMPLFAWFEGENISEKSFNQFKADVEALGTFFYGLGLSPDRRKKGELPPRIAVIGENSYDWIVTYFAVVNGGSVIVPLDKELPENSLRDLIEESGASAIVYADSYSDIFEKMRKSKRPKCLKTFINMKNDIPMAISKGKDAIAAGEFNYLKHRIKEEITCAILFTSGTTGVSKGVELTHRGLAQNVVSAHKVAKIVGDTVLLLPLHHTYGFGATVVSSLLRGVRCVINSSLKNVMRDIGESRPEFLCVVPLYVESFYKNIWGNIKRQNKEAIMNSLIKASNAMLKVGIDVRRIFFAAIIKAFGGRLRLIVSGGAPISKDLILGFGDLGITVIEGYGISECSPIVAINPDRATRLGSVGPATPGTEVQILDKDTETGHGEIAVRGAIVMNGYYKRPDITEATMQNGWFRTGDIGYLDNEGYLFITGRKKNLIIRANGKNVHPEELESLMLKREEICEVVVKESGKYILAEIFPEYESEELVGLNEKQIEKKIDRIIKEINKDLPVYKKINKIVMRNIEFEKTTTKKIKRW